MSIFGNLDFVSLLNLQICDRTEFGQIFDGEAQQHKGLVSPEGDGLGTI